MPKDKRLYMTFPIDFPDHPKVKPLTKAAKWDFVEMNAYSRRMELDGRIPVVTARVMWPKKSLDDLCESHPDRPLVLLDGDAYVIRDYSEHQFTTEDLRNLHENAARAGKAGGEAKAAAKRKADEALAAASSEGYQNVARSESRSGTDKSRPDTAPPLSHEIPARDELTTAAESLGIKDMARIRRAFAGVPLAINDAEAIDLVRSLLADSTTHVVAVEAYVEKACQKRDSMLERATVVLAGSPRAVLGEVA